MVRNLPRDSRRALARVALICLVGVLAYSNTFAVPFHFDGKEFIAANGAIRDLRHVGAIWGYWPTRFATFLSFAVNYALHGMRVAGYHAVNLAIHVAAACLLWRFIRTTMATPEMREDRLCGHTDALALFAALIFVAHPVQTQAVTYLYQRAASLAACLYLLALSLYAEARRRETAGESGRGVGLMYCGAWAAGFVGMFAKETAFTLPFAIALYDFCFYPLRDRARVRRVLPFFALLAVIPLTLLLTGGAQLGKVGSMESLPLQERSDILGVTTGDYLLTQFRVLATYMRLLVAPLKQNLDYDYPLSATLWHASTLGALCLHLLLVGLAAVLLRRRPAVAFCILWFFLALSMECGIIRFRDVIFEYRLYLAVAAYAFLLSMLLHNVLRHRPRAAAVLLAVAVLAYGGMTYLRNIDWRSELSLWDDTVRKSPNKARPHAWRGYAFMEAGVYDRALADFNRSLAIYPAYASARQGRALALLSMRRYEDATADLDRLLAARPDSAVGWNARATARRAMKRYPGALSDLDRAAALAPEWAIPHYNRGAMYAETGDDRRAVASFTRAIRRNPAYAAAFLARGTLYLRSGERERGQQDMARYRELAKGAPNRP